MYLYMLYLDSQLNHIIITVIKYWVHSTARKSAHVVHIKLKSSLSLLHTHTQVNTRTVGGPQGSNRMVKFIQQHHLVAIIFLVFSLIIEVTRMLRLPNSFQYSLCSCSMLLPVIFGFFATTASTHGIRLLP